MAPNQERLKRAPEVVLIAGVLAAGDEALRVATSLMEEGYGPVRMASEPAAFTWSRYYATEMGVGLTRRFLAFERSIDPGLLRQAKLASVDFERAHAHEGRRVFNLDPAYLTLNTLVVASTKDASYRVYLGEGIYAQPMLVYKEGAFQPLEWTYPDYRDPAHLGFFEAVRRDGLDRGVLRGRRPDGDSVTEGG